MKKAIISISCIILALTMCIGFVSCSKDEADPETTTNEGKEVVLVTDENGEAVTDANGDAVTEEATKADSTDSTESKTTTGKPVTDKNGDKVTNKNGEVVTEAPKTTKASGKTTTKKGKTTTKKTTTTTTTIVYTTTDPNAPIELPELPEEGYLLTADLAMVELQTKYDTSKYIVNITEATSNTANLTVYYLSDSEVYSTAKVNLKDGKTTETIKKTNKKSTYYLGQ